MGNVIDNYNDETDLALGSYYYLNSGKTKNIGTLNPYPKNIVFAFLPIKKDKTTEFKFSFSSFLTDDYNIDKIYQSFIIYECTEQFFSYCTYNKTLNLENNIYENTFKILYTVNQKSVNYLLFKIKPNNS